MFYLVFALSLGAPQAQIPLPRVIAAKTEIPLPAQSSEFANLPRRLVVKFVDTAKARLDNGSLVFRGAIAVEPVAEFAEARRLAFVPLIRSDESRIDALIERAVKLSGEAQPDLLGMMAVETSEKLSDLELTRLGNDIQALPDVEWAEIQLLDVPPPGDIAPPTPTLVANQGYRGPNPGIDAIYANSVGVLGAGIRLSDCEYGWKYQHEDLVDIGIVPEPGHTTSPFAIANGWDEHGTAVLGETSATANAYGVTGMAGGAAVYTYPENSIEGGSRRVECITNAIADSNPGDVVLLEMQAVGAGGNYGPAELENAVYTVVKVGVAAGVIVVGAAGNGNQNLDASVYASYMAKGDSGAILVGAGTASTNHDKLSFSTYGNRVNVQGWGENVFSTGYGSFAQYGGDVNQRYTATFSGTSSASPFVASACVLLQSYWKSRTGGVLPPKVLRTLLVDTGIPQGSGGKIGPLPNLKAAIQALSPWLTTGSGVSGVLGVPTFHGFGPMTPTTPVKLFLSKVKPLAATTFLIGASRVDLPLLGGILVPSPQIVFTTVTDVSGSLDVTASMPAGFASGAKLYIQAWSVDPAAIHGASASKALEITLP